MRKIAMTAYSFAAAAFFYAYLLAGQTPLWVLIGLAATSCLGLLLLRRLRRYLAVRLVLAGLAAGFLWCAGWARFVLSDANAYAGTTQTVEATVLTSPVQAAFGFETEIQLGITRCRLYFDAGTQLEPGQRIRLNARFAASSEKSGGDYALSQGLPLFAYAKEPPQPLGYAAGRWRFWPAKLGQALRDRLTQVFDPDTAPFLTAVLTGERGPLQEDAFFYAMLKESGIVHCVAVSGMHLSFLVAFLYVLLGRGRLSALIWMPVIALFMAMTGFTPSVVRAGIMLLAVCCASLTKRDYDSRTALPLALALLLAGNPFSIRNAGLQLSFAATLGIVLFQQPIYRALPQLPAVWSKRSLPALAWRYVMSSLAVSLSAMVLTVPITAAVFGQVSLLAPLTNLAALWAVALAFSLGLAAAAVAFIYLPAAVVLGYPARLLVSYIRLVATGLGRLPLASVYTSSSYILLWLICVYALLAVFRYVPGLRHRLAGFFGVALAALAIFWGLGVLEVNGDALRVAALDVGQGQCVVLTAKGTAVVADCGSFGYGEAAGDQAARYLLSMGRTSVDALILTHYHLDHASGALELLRRMPVAQLYAPEPVEPAEWALLEEAAALGAEIHTLSPAAQPVRCQIGLLDCLLTPPLGGRGDNELGVAALCSLDDFDVLLTGDLSSASELRLLERVSLPDTELMVAGHHGSNGSNSARLLAAAAPDAAVVSVGRNSYGLPADAAIARLEAAGAAVYRTDRSGTVILSYRKEGTS